VVRVYRHQFERLAEDQLLRREIMKVYLFCLFAALLGTASLGQEVDSPQGNSTAQVGMEVLTRGPIHEAFAGTVTFDPEPGIVVSKVPPEAIEELPPDQKPDGANVVWIPGYWAWDDERNDFLWISGIWRNLPPGRQWVPGYWGETSEGFQWTSGYWADASDSEIQYLAEPPASVEVGPNIAAASPDQIWMPGCWIWSQNRYVWRPGYWSAGQQEWVWVPACYAWTPRGYVFVDGYYDYAVADRGMLFAPVYFNSSVYTRRGFSYSPIIVINSAVFGSQLFLRPNYQHYYFGDYYAASYSNAGFYPWFSYNSNSHKHGYDPIYAQQRWQNRGDRSWERNVQADFQHRRDHEEARPKHTLAAQNSLVASQDDSIQKGLVVAASLAALAKSKDNSLRLKPVAQEERQKLAQNGKEVHKFRQERQQLETKAAVTTPANPAKPSAPEKVARPRSPLVSRPVDQLGKNQVPPKRHENLKPNPEIEPKARVRTESAPGSKVEAKPPKAKSDSPKGNPPGSKRTESVPPKPKEPEEKRADKAPRAGENLPNPTTPSKRDDPQKPQPKVDRPDQKPQPQPKAEAPAKQPQGKPGVAPESKKSKDNGKGNGNGKGKDKGKDK
jgi:WXXGXW repeat (2 copies)